MPRPQNSEKLKSIFSSNLKHYMKEKDINTADLARALSYSFTTVSDWVNGRKYPRMDKVQELADYFEILKSDLTEEHKRSHTNTPPYSLEASKLADAYDNKLDRWGRQAVRELVETEIARCEDESQLRESLLKEEPKIINLFVEPSAAGIAVPTVGRDYEFYELKPEDPPGAAYAVRLQGNSMEPDFPDGSIVFVNHDAMRDGDIGIFSVDGGTVCKQYHQEGGVVYLFSLNRRRADADLVLFPGGNQRFVCQGRVITQKRFPVPGRD